MRTRIPSNAIWIAIALFLLWGKRKARGSGNVPPNEHKIPKHLSLTQLRELAAAADMAQPEVAAAVAMAESGGRVDAVGDHGDSIGLWQIHVPSAPKQWANRDMLKHAGFNAQAAAAMSNGGTDFSAWTTFRNGAYLRFLPKGR